MTTKIIIEPAGRPVLVRTMDAYTDPSRAQRGSAASWRPNMGGLRTISVVDLDPTDTRAA